LASPNSQGSRKNAVGLIGSNASQGAAPDNDTFGIQTWRIGPLYFVTANEFAGLKYFGSLEEAESYAWEEFSGHIEALNDRECEDDDE
jgi:hypothetical protein